MKSSLICGLGATSIVLIGGMGCGSSSPTPGVEPIGSKPTSDASDFVDGAIDTTLDGSQPSSSDDGPPSVVPEASVPEASAPEGYPPSFTKYGTIGVRWRHTAMDAAVSDFTDTAAVFIDFGAAGSACTSVSVGACVHVSCPGPDGGVASTQVDPGLVTLGTAPMQSTLTFAGNADAASANMILWPSGTSIPITSAGSASVPTWSTAVTMPALAAVTAPATFGQGGLTVSRGSDFAIAWQGSQELVASMERINVGVEQLYCTLTGGQGVMPAAALAMLPPGTYAFELFTASRQYFSVGGWSIRATADVDATCSNGASCSEDATLD